jgi:hypothetical protein
MLPFDLLHETCLVMYSQRSEHVHTETNASCAWKLPTFGPSIHALPTLRQSKRDSFAAERVDQLSNAFNSLSSIA